MKKVIEFNSSNSKIGLFTRKPKKGPEEALVRLFAAHVTDSFKDKNSKLAIFYEPQLDTGFPDIVFVEYCPQIFDSWKEDRLSIRPIDLKILQHLYFVKGADAFSIENQIGVNSKTLIGSLERLLDSGFIYRSAKQWTPYRLKRNFAIKRIAAVEAKINNWKSAFQQAQINKWFASESYVLSPIVKPNSNTIETSKNLGIGIYTYNKDGASKISNCIQGPLPSCYASWSFNEWIGRYLHSGTH